MVGGRIGGGSGIDGARIAVPNNADEFTIIVVSWTCHHRFTPAAAAAAAAATTTIVGARRTAHSAGLAALSRANPVLSELSQQPAPHPPSPTAVQPMVLPVCLPACLPACLRRRSGVRPSFRPRVLLFCALLLLC